MSWNLLPFQLENINKISTKWQVTQSECITTSYQNEKNTKENLEWKKTKSPQMAGGTNDAVTQNQSACKPKFSLQWFHTKSLLTHSVNLCTMKMLTLSQWKQMQTFLPPVKIFTILSLIGWTLNHITIGQYLYSVKEWRKSKFRVFCGRIWCNKFKALDCQ